MLSTHSVTVYSGLHVHRPSGTAQQVVAIAITPTTLTVVYRELRHIASVLFCHYSDFCEFWLFIFPLLSGSGSDGAAATAVRNATAAAAAAAIKT